MQSVPIAVEDVTLLLKLKQFTPKKDAKLPNTIEMRTTIPGVTLANAYYLKVVGLGISPVSAPCQAQAASLKGTRPMAIDSAGIVVGPAVSTDISANQAVEVLISDGIHARTAQLRTATQIGYCGPSLLIPGNEGNISYTTSDCTGSAYASNAVASFGSIAYIVTGPPVFITSNSTRRADLPGCPCQVVSAGVTVYPVVGVDTGIFTPPFRIELR